MDESLWHKCRAPLFSRKTVDGGNTEDHGQTWRRKVDGGWQYKQDAETWDEFESRAPW